MIQQYINAIYVEGYYTAVRRNEKIKFISLNRRVMFCSLYSRKQFKTLVSNITFRSIMADYGKLGFISICYTAWLYFN